MAYNPIPPRVWSRVQHPCLTDTIDLSYVQLVNQKQMLLKGNVLQYKKNSSNLTKQQKYTQIAKGQWTGRRKCFAAQSETYTNPNTSSFQRVNFTTIPYPNNIVGAPNNVSGPFQPNAPNPFDCSSNVLVDGGSLVGNTYVNPCSGAIVRKTYESPCNLTTASDVPGPAQILCWDPSIATWYPRQNLTMPTSGDKWPEGYKGLVSAVTPIPPVLYNNLCSLSWTYNNCLPISNFYIYRDGVLIQIVPYAVTTISINDLVPLQTYNFKIRSVSSGIESEFSNSIIVQLPRPETPSLQEITVVCPGVVLNWDISSNPCPPIDSFNIYQVGISSPIQNVLYPALTTTVYGLSPDISYNFYTKSVRFSVESNTSNIVTVTIPGPPQNVSYDIVNQTSVTLHWDPPITTDYITGYRIYNNTGPLIDLSSNELQYTITIPTINTSYTYGISTLYGYTCESSQITISVIIPFTIAINNNTNINNTLSNPTIFIYDLVNIMSTGTATLQLNCPTSLTVNMMIIGGGGAGSNGGTMDPPHSTQGGSCGGGGGGITQISFSTSGGSYDIPITVGGKGDGGHYPGNSGGDSSATISNTLYTSTHGSGGLAQGAIDYGGGNGGTGPILGGGGGGGAASTNGGTTRGGLPNGGQADKISLYGTGLGGSGGDSSLNYILDINNLHFLFSGGGSGGSSSYSNSQNQCYGGFAGAGVGGQVTPNTPPNGQSANIGLSSDIYYYGGGGGGGGGGYYNGNVVGLGGSGSTGAIILWV